MARRSEAEVMEDTIGKRQDWGLHRQSQLYSEFRFTKSWKESGTNPIIEHQRSFLVNLWEEVWGNTMPTIMRIDI